MRNQPIRSWRLWCRVILLCFVGAFLNCSLVRYSVKLIHPSIPLPYWLYILQSSSAHLLVVVLHLNSVNPIRVLPSQRQPWIVVRQDKGETIYTKRVAISHWILPWGWPDYIFDVVLLKTTAPKQRTCSKRDDVRLLF